MNRNQLANQIIIEIGIPDELETRILTLINDKFDDELIDKHKYYALSNDVTDAKDLIRLARRILFRIVDELIEKEIKNEEAK